MFKTGVRQSDVMTLLFAAKGSITHHKIAESLGVGAFRVCAVLNSLEKSGRAQCVVRSEKGRNPLPGVWQITLKGEAWMKGETSRIE